MALGKFTLTGNFPAYDESPKRITSVRIIGKPAVVVDKDGNKIYTAPSRPVTADGSFAIELVTDVTEGESTAIGYRVIVALYDAPSVAAEFWAQPAGATIDMADITSQVVDPVSPDAASTTELAAVETRVTTVETTKANSADLATVATTGAYTDLNGTPTIPATAADVGAEPAGLSAETKAAQDAAFADRELVDSGRLSEAALSATYARKTKALAAALAEANTDPQPAIPASVPTITYSSGGTLARVHAASGFGEENGVVALIGQRGTWDPANAKLEVHSGLITALDCYVYDSDIEFGYVEQTQGGSRVWVWVDGKPATAVPSTAPLSVAAGANIVGKIAFGSVARRRVTIWASNMNAWKWVRCNATGIISAAQRGPRIALVGDSWWGGSAPSPGLACASSVIARTFNANAHIEAIGGTGYLAGTYPFGHASRVARVQEFDPDLILFMGSINDGTATGLQAAATAAYDDYAAACPGVPMIVFGPQPSSATDTISATRAATVAAIKAAADAHPAVIGFHDQIGTASGTVPPAWASYASYNNGDLVTFKGSVYEWRGGDGVSTGPYDPSASSSWFLRTWVLTGTGLTGTPAGDGTRDVALGSDNAHPTPAGSMALGILEAAKVRESLRAAVA